MISHVEFNPLPHEDLSHSRRRRRRWKVRFGEATNYSSRQKNLQYLSRKIITIVMVHKPQTDIYIPALTRKNKINTSVTQRYHFDFILGTKRTWCSYDEDSRNNLESTTELKRQTSKSVIRKD